MSMFLKCITYDINANVLGFSIWSKSSIMKSSFISGDLSFSFSPHLFLYFKYSKIQLVSRSGVVKQIRCSERIVSIFVTVFVKVTSYNWYTYIYFKADNLRIGIAPIRQLLDIMKETITLYFKSQASINFLISSLV